MVSWPKQQSLAWFSLHQTAVDALLAATPHRDPEQAPLELCAFEFELPTPSQQQQLQVADPGGSTAGEKRVPTPVQMAAMAAQLAAQARLELAEVGRLEDLLKS